MAWPRGVLFSKAINNRKAFDGDLKFIGFVICGAIHFLPIWYDPKGPLSRVHIKEIFTRCLTRWVLRQVGIRCHPEGYRRESFYAEHI